MSLKVVIKKSLYNSGKSEFSQILDAEFKLLSLKKDRSLIFDGISEWLNELSLAPTVSLERSINTSSGRHCDNFSNDYLQNINFSIVEKSFRPDSSLFAFHQPRSFRIIQISKQLRKLKSSFKYKKSENLFFEIKSLVQELRSLINKQFHKERRHLKSLRKIFFGILNIDIRQRFRILVRNLYNCFSDCSKSDDDDISVTQASYTNLSFNHTIGNDVQQKKYYRLVRFFY